jgi:RNA polymerase sigma-70 factor (ECF subfamily)
MMAGWADRLDPPMHPAPARPAHAEIGNAAPDGDPLARLMSAAQGGNQAAYSDLLKAIVPLVRRYAARRCPFLGHADLDDLVQDVLLSIHAVRSTYDPNRAFKPWLFAIAHHRVVDTVRRRALRSANEVAADDVPFDQAPDPACDEAPFGDSSAIHQALSALPRNQRKALELLKLKEMSLKEAAAEIGSTVGALKVSTHRAMASLRRSLIGATD